MNFFWSVFCQLRNEPPIAKDGTFGTNPLTEIAINASVAEDGIVIHAYRVHRTFDDALLAFSASILIQLLLRKENFKHGLLQQN